METEALIAKPQSGMKSRLLAAVVPVLFVAITYVDPGKWVAAVEGGARFGFDLIVLMFVFSLAAVLCQYLSASIAAVTGKDLAQICSTEYDTIMCVFLGVQAELSMIVLDLSMILGTAHGLNLMFGMSLFTCVFLTSLDAFLFPIFSGLLETGKAKFVCVRMASIALLSYVFGVLVNQPDTSLSMGGMLTKFSGESAFALISLLGASIMPHNFYLHSSIVQQNQGPADASKGALCHDHLVAISGIFSGIFIVNFVVMNSAANVFYSTGLDLLTFQDALSLTDQVFRSLMAPFALILILTLTNHTMALMWKFSGQTVLHNFFKIDVPGWGHHSTIRFIAIIPGLLCAWHSGAEGTYQMLIFTQIVVALLLPSAVIPLFRVASSRSVMGANKISQFTEFLLLITFIGMLGLAIVFVIEMVFGNSDWASNIRWSMGSTVSVPYVALLVIAFLSLSLMLWLVVTPLKSASLRSDSLKWDMQDTVTESFLEERHERHVSEAKYRVEDTRQKQETTLPSEKLPEYRSELPTVMLPDSDKGPTSEEGPRLVTIEENSAGLGISAPPVSQPEKFATTVDTVSSSVVSCGASDGKLQEESTLKNVSVESVEKTLRIDGNLRIAKDHERDAWEPEESPKVASGMNQSLTSEGPGSYRSLGGRCDDIGSGTGSLSKLAGLGRAARRQLAAVLDEFWGQLFDFHGEPTQEARTRKLDKLLGIDSKANSKPSPALVKTDNVSKEFNVFVPAVGTGVSESLVNPSFYESSRPQSVQSSIDSTYGVQRGSTSLLSSQMQILDAYAQHSNFNVMDPGEKRYHSLRLQSSSSGLRLPQVSGPYDDQPATVHGYQIKSLINQTKQRSDYFSNQMDPLAPNSPSRVSSNYKAPYPLTKTLQNGSTPAKPPGFPDPVISRNSSMQPERTYYNLRNMAPAENMHSVVNEKKYYSMPDISGLSLPRRDSSVADRDPQWDGATRYGTLGRKIPGQSIYSGSSFRSGSPPYDEFSYKKLSVDAAAYQPSSGADTWSIWSRQPFEQFGVAEKVNNSGVGVGSRLSSSTQETSSTVDLEANLLKSFRLCIVKLLKLEGSDWLFQQNDGVDEDLVERVAARERFLYEVESKDMGRMAHSGDSQFSHDRKNVLGSKVDDAEYAKFLVTSVPNCGDGCVWRADLITSFGVWCIHRVLELSLMESRPELWGKYTYVLNRLQGIIELAFAKPRTAMSPCFCLQLPDSYQQKSSPPKSNSSLPPPAKPNRGKCTTASSLLDIVKDVEIAISCRKGRTGTAAGDVAFPKGKENLASVLKRYKRRLSNKPAATPDGATAGRKSPLSTTCGL